VSNSNHEKCGIENEKGQIHISGFTLFGWDIICISHRVWPVDMLVFIADSKSSLITPS
jgi:hypothetical protein